ncbi:MAG: hypothetical protein ACK4R6_03375 [Spirosomataceae bacterium]
MKLTKELQKAILELPDKEKDKLLLRLITKNDLLVEQLTFQLLEDESDIERRRNYVKRLIISTITAVHVSSIGWLLMDIRACSGAITRHVKVTKDKYGEIELTLFLLERVLVENEAVFQTYSRKLDKLMPYLLKKVESILKKIKGFPEDYHLDFTASLEVILDGVHTGLLAGMAKQMRLPTADNWMDVV